MYMAGNLNNDIVNSGHKQKSTKKSSWAYYLIDKREGIVSPDRLTSWQSGLLVWKVQMEPNNYKWIKFGIFMTWVSHFYLMFFFARHFGVLIIFLTVTVTSTLCAKDNKTMHEPEKEVLDAKRSK
ncbi:hypothetical protein Hanom_Chr11g01061381 [Helianthus anomalus]